MKKFLDYEQNQYLLCNDSTIDPDYIITRDTRWDDFNHEMLTYIYYQKLDDYPEDYWGDCNENLVYSLGCLVDHITVNLEKSIVEVLDEMEWNFLSSQNYDLELIDILYNYIIGNKTYIKDKLNEQFS